jgi:GNAT superfamily N-acetyltransferase
VNAERCFAARAAADTRSADSSEEIGGGIRLSTPTLPDIWDLNVALLGPDATDDEVAAALALDVRRVTLFRSFSGPVPEGSTVERSLLMVADDPPPAMPEGVEEVDFRALSQARAALEDEYADQIAAMHARQAAAGARTFAVGEVAWAVLADGCIDDVFVVEARRGEGLGRAVTQAALAHGGWFLWCAQDDPRPQALYRSLGMVEAGRVVQFTRPAG